jgi:hypothetical protein
MKMQPKGKHRGVQKYDLDVAELRRLLADPDLTLQQVADRMGCSLSTIFARKEELGIERPGAPRLHTEGLRPDATGLPARADRQAEIREIEPWPEGIWFGPRPEVA